MHRERLAWLRLGAVLFDGLALLGAWLAVVHLRAAVGGWAPGLPPIAPGSHLPLAALVVPAWLLAVHLMGGYGALRRKAWERVALELLVAGASALTVTLALLFLLKLDHVSRLTLVAFAAVSLPTLGASRWLHLALLRTMRRRRFDPHLVLLVGREAEAGPYLQAIARHPEWGITLAGVASVDDLSRRLVAEPIDEVYLTGAPPPEVVSHAAQVCDELGVRLSLDANFLGLQVGRPELCDFDGWALLSFPAGPAGDVELALKRSLDVAGAALLLVLLGPLILGAALLVRLEDGGPAFYVQRRAGRHGRLFALLKLRTMAVDADRRLAGLQGHNEMSGPVFKMRDDPRVTRVGRWLRRFSIDELPQLLHVLTGQMSLVGPRPPLPEEVRRYERWQLRRLSVRPGLTCTWQVSGRNEIDFDRWMALDLEYIDNWSLWLDLRLLARTVPAVLRGTGAR